MKVICRLYDLNEDVLDNLWNDEVSVTVDAGTFEAKEVRSTRLEGCWEVVEVLSAAVVAGALTVSFTTLRRDFTTLRLGTCGFKLSRARGDGMVWQVMALLFSWSRRRWSRELVPDKARLYKALQAMFNILLIFMAVRFTGLLSWGVPSIWKDEL